MAHTKRGPQEAEKGGRENTRGTKVERVERKREARKGSKERETRREAERVSEEGREREDGRCGAKHVR
jgi:hypothetical protein